MQKILKFNLFQWVGLVAIAILILIALLGGKQVFIDSLWVLIPAAGGLAWWLRNRRTSTTAHAHTPAAAPAAAGGHGVVHHAAQATHFMTTHWLPALGILLIVVGVALYFLWAPDPHDISEFMWSRIAIATLLGMAALIIGSAFGVSTHVRNAILVILGGMWIMTILGDYPGFVATLRGAPPLSALSSSTSIRNYQSMVIPVGGTSVKIPVGKGIRLTVTPELDLAKPAYRVHCFDRQGNETIFGDRTRPCLDGAVQWQSFENLGSAELVLTYERGRY